MAIHTKVKTEKFNEDKINLIKHNLEQHIDTGQPRFYEIQVDGLKAVSKTTDTTQFDNYELYISDSTDEIKFMLYHGNSHKYDAFIFTMKEEVKPIPQPTLNDIPNTIDEKIKQAMRERDVQEYKKRIKELEEELEQGRDYIEELEENAEQLLKKVEGLTLLASKEQRMTTLMTLAIEKGAGFFSRNPELLSKIPFLGETLAGDIIKQREEAEHQAKQTPPSPPNSSNEPTSTFNEK